VVRVGWDEFYIRQGMRKSEDKGGGWEERVTWILYNPFDRRIYTVDVKVWEEDNMWELSIAVLAENHVVMELKFINGGAGYFEDVCVYTDVLPVSLSDDDVDKLLTGICANVSECLVIKEFRETVVKEFRSSG